MSEETETQYSLYRDAYHSVRDLLEVLKRLEPFGDDEDLFNYAVIIEAKLHECHAEISYKSLTRRRGDTDK